MQKILKQIFSSEGIFASHCSHTAEYLLQNIRFEANIRKTLKKFHIQANIHFQKFPYKRKFACKYSHTSKYSPLIALI
jgi:hypothetical protein